MQGFPKFWDAGREDCLCFEQDHPKFSLQEGHSRGTESPDRGPVSTVKTDRLHDPRLFRVTCAHDTVFDFSDLFSVTLRDDNVEEFDTRWDEVFYHLCQGYRLMMFWIVCANWGYVSLINSRPHLNCMRWRFIKRYRCYLSKISDDDEKKYRSESSITKFISTPDTGKSKQEQWSRVERA